MSSLNRPMADGADTQQPSTSASTQQPSKKKEYRKLEPVTPEQLAQEDLMNNCAVKTVISGIMGSALGLVFGVFMGAMDSAVGIPLGPDLPPACIQPECLQLAPSVGERQSPLLHITVNGPARVSHHRRAGHYACESPSGVVLPATGRNRDCGLSSSKHLHVLQGPGMDMAGAGAQAQTQTTSQAIRQMLKTTGQRSM